MKKNVKGITLVALVVTIIVLLILAGIAINLTIGNNGLFSRAKNAVNVWDKAAENETKAIDDFIKLYDNEVINNSESNQKRYYFKLNGIDCYWTEEENSGIHAESGTVPGTELMDWFSRHIRGISFEFVYAAMFDGFIDGRQIGGCYYMTEMIREGDELTLYYDTSSSGEPVSDLAERIHYD